MAMKLAEVGQAQAYEIAFWLAGIHSPDYPLHQLGGLSMEVSSKLRAVAIMVLLAKADVDRFLHNLIRSGMARETFLRRCRDEGALEAHHRASGRTGALLDALAAGERDLAQRIVELSPTELRQGHEYEDDYCYAQVLHRWILGGPAEADVPALFDRWDVYLAGMPDARLPVCRAIAARDQGAFDEAFEDLLARREGWIDEQKDRNGLENRVFVAEQHIYIEGLALLRFAEACGISTQPEYRMCPSLARMPMTTPFPGE